jgi:hypothetical protein
MCLKWRRIRLGSNIVQRENDPEGWLQGNKVYYDIGLGKAFIILFGGSVYQMAGS